jgi:hypothetical protein
MQCPYCKEDIQDGATICKHCKSNIGAASGQSVPEGQGGFGESFGTALNVWKANLADLAVLTLVFMLVVWIPIANVGFIAGYTRSVLKVARGQGKAAVGDIFNAWDCFGSLFGYVLLLVIASAILNIIPVLGFLASMALGFAAMPGMYAIIDGKRGMVDGFKWSLESVKAHFVDWLLAYIAGYVIAMIGVVVFIIGVVLSAPLAMLIFVQQYDRVKPA